MSDPMTMMNLLAFLRSKGLKVTRRRIEFALETFKIKEPERGDRGHRAWTKREAQSVYKHFAKK